MIPALWLYLSAFAADSATPVADRAPPQGGDASNDPFDSRAGARGAGAAGAGPTPISLAAAMDLAEGRASVRAADHRAAAARGDVTTALLGAVGPRVGGGLTTTERTQEIAIDTPIGPFVQQPKRIADAAVRGELPVDLSLLLGGVPAASAGARAADHAARRERELARLAAGESYLDVVAIDARITALDALVASLDEARGQVGALVAAGLAVEVDRLRIDVARSDAEVGRMRLRAARDAAVRALAWRLGVDGPVDVAFAWAPPPVPPPVDAAAGAAEARADLRALEERGRATAHLARAAALEGLPTVGVWGGVIATDNQVLVAKRWVEGGLQVSWAPVAGGTRIARNRALAEHGRAIRADLDDARAGLRAELEAARAGVVAGLVEVEARDVALRQAREAERVVAARYGQGLATVTDALAAAAARADTEAAARLARVEVTRAALRWEAAVGDNGWGPAP